MKKALLIIMLSITFMLTACNNYQKPPLTDTQVVNGVSIVMPPEFYVLPKQKSEQQ